VIEKDHCMIGEFINLMKDDIIVQESRKNIEPKNTSKDIQST